MNYNQDIFNEENLTYEAACERSQDWSFMRNLLYSARAGEPFSLDNGIRLYEKIVLDESHTYVFDSDKLRNVYGFLELGMQKDCYQYDQRFTDLCLKVQELLYSDMKEHWKDSSNGERCVQYLLFLGRRNPEEEEIERGRWFCSNIIKEEDGSYTIADFTERCRKTAEATRNGGFFQNVELEKCLKQIEAYQFVCAFENKDMRVEHFRSYQSIKGLIACLKNSPSHKDRLEAEVISTAEQIYPELEAKEQKRLNNLLMKEGYGGWKDKVLESVQGCTSISDLQQFLAVYPNAQQRFIDEYIQYSNKDKNAIFELLNTIKDRDTQQLILSRYLEYYPDEKESLIRVAEMVHEFLMKNTEREIVDPVWEMLARKKTEKLQAAEKSIKTERIIETEKIAETGKTVGTTGKATETGISKEQVESPGALARRTGGFLSRLIFKAGPSEEENE